MKFYLQLGAKNGRGTVTNPVTGESYHCTWEVTVTQNRPVPYPFERRNILAEMEDTSLDIMIDVEGGFFRPAAAQPENALPVPALPEDSDGG